MNSASQDSPKQHTVFVSARSGKPLPAGVIALVCTGFLSVSVGLSRTVCGASSDEPAAPQAREGLWEEKYLSHDPATGPRPAFSKIYDTVENRALWKLMRADSGRITIREITLFHRRLIDRCMTDLPDKVILQYNGSLRESRPPKRWIHGDDGVMHSLTWDVVSDLGIFSFWLSTRRTNISILDLEIDGRRLFVNVDFVCEYQSVDKKLPQLGDKSVREVLSLLKTNRAKDRDPKPVTRSKRTETDRGENRPPAGPGEGGQTRSPQKQVRDG